MQAAQSGGVDGIAADCGGSLTCATCHVIVREPWASQLPPPGADELAMLEFTAELRQPNSRLSCQIQLTDALTALQADAALVEGFGADFVRYYSRVKQSEAQRHALAEDPTDFERREYFSRF